MAFGETYKFVQPTQALKDGTYCVRLKKPYETRIGGYSVLRFPFIPLNVEGVFQPDHFDLFDCVNPNDEKELMAFRKTASKIKACFLLSGSFCEASYARWENAEGLIEVKKGNNGFTNVVNWLPSDRYMEYKDTL